MKKGLAHIVCFCLLNLMVIACEKSSEPVNPPAEGALVNTSHLDNLYTPVTFSDGTKAGGVYIYCEAPDYHPVGATGEGYVCVDDVARAALVYLRSPAFASDTSMQSKAVNLIRFVLKMQSDNGYFYNFIFNSGLINTSGATSVNNANWWSWRALQTLTEGAPVVKNIDATLATEMDNATVKLVNQIKTDLINIPQTTTVIQGITIPIWLPAGSATDQAALLIIGLIPYCEKTGDAVIKDYIAKLVDGIALMQAGDASHYPYSCFLSWENTWHAYANIQAYALLKAGAYMNKIEFTTRALAELDNFYAWILNQGFKSSFTLKKDNDIFYMITESDFDQIAYGISPMVFAAVEAYKISGDDKYADLGGHLAAWFLGANVANVNMYDKATGRCYDGITTGGSVNYNSGAESTIEALLALQLVESYPAVKTALDKYKK